MPTLHYATGSKTGHGRHHEVIVSHASTSMGTQKLSVNKGQHRLQVLQSSTVPWGSLNDRKTRPGLTYIEVTETSEAAVKTLLSNLERRLRPSEIETAMTILSPNYWVKKQGKPSILSSL